MHRPAIAFLTLFLVVIFCLKAPAQAPDKSEQMLEALSKKIDEQNAKIDTLSQQILKLEQQISKTRPGVIIGETPSPSPASERPPTRRIRTSPAPGASSW